jgi:hypothetical protein
VLSAPALSISITLIRRDGRHMSPAASSFWSLVLEHLESEHSRVGVAGARPSSLHTPRVLVGGTS